MYCIKICLCTYYICIYTHACVCVCARSHMVIICLRTQNCWITGFCLGPDLSLSQKAFGVILAFPGLSGFEWRTSLAMLNPGWFTMTTPGSYPQITILCQNVSLLNGTVSSQRKKRNPLLLVRKNLTHCHVTNEMATTNDSHNKSGYFPWPSWSNMVVSINRGTPKWMVYTGKSHENGWFWGTPIYGNHPMSQSPTMFPSMAQSTACWVSATISCFLSSIWPVQ